MVLGRGHMIDAGSRPPPGAPWGSQARSVPEAAPRVSCSHSRPRPPSSDARRMRTLLPTALVLAAALLAPAAASAAHDLPLRHALDRYVASGVPGAVVLVRDGNRTTRMTSGVGRLDSREPARATIASRRQLHQDLHGDGRPATRRRRSPLAGGHGRALAAGSSAERRERDAAPAADAYGRARRLLPAPGVLRPVPRGRPPAFLAPQDLLDAAVAKPPIFAPGAGWQYSNTGYMLLGHIVQAATGESIQAHLQRRIFKPLRYVTRRSTSSRRSPAATHTVTADSRRPLRIWSTSPTGARPTPGRRAPSSRRPMPPPRSTGRCWPAAFSDPTCSSR